MNTTSINSSKNQLPYFIFQDNDPWYSKLCKYVLLLFQAFRESSTINAYLPNLSEKNISWITSSQARELGAEKIRQTSKKCLEALNPIALRTLSEEQLTAYFENCGLKQHMEISSSGDYVLNYIPITAKLVDTLTSQQIKKINLIYQQNRPGFNLTTFSRDTVINVFTDAQLENYFKEAAYEIENGKIDPTTFWPIFKNDLDHIMTVMDLNYSDIAECIPLDMIFTLADSTIERHFTLIYHLNNTIINTLDDKYLSKVEYLNKLPSVLIKELNQDERQNPAIANALSQSKHVQGGRRRQEKEPISLNLNIDPKLTTPEFESVARMITVAIQDAYRDDTGVHEVNYSAFEFGTRSGSISLGSDPTKNEKADANKKLQQAISTTRLGLKERDPRLARHSEISRLLTELLTDTDDSHRHLET
ncbi:MAG: hypothetical protein P4L16_07185 [Chlamydiales bacterium]|nr:hypothetical protein [Chlamydiales bacterium]